MPVPQLPSNLCQRRKCVHAMHRESLRGGKYVVPSRSKLLSRLSVREQVQRKRRLRRGVQQKVLGKPEADRRSCALRAGLLPSSVPTIGSAHAVARGSWTRPGYSARSAKLALPGAGAVCAKSRYSSSHGGDEFRRTAIALTTTPPRTSRKSSRYAGATDEPERSSTLNVVVRRRELQEREEPLTPSGLRGRRRSTCSRRRALCARRPSRPPTQRRRPGAWCGACRRRSRRCESCGRGWPCA